jgi:hypothetical protein
MYKLLMTTALVTTLTVPAYAGQIMVQGNGNELCSVALQHNWWSRSGEGSWVLGYVTGVEDQLVANHKMVNLLPGGTTNLLAHLVWEQCEVKPGWSLFQAAETIGNRLIQDNLS